MVDPVVLRPEDRPLPEPSAMLWGEFLRLGRLAAKDRKEFDAELDFHRTAIAAHRGNASVMRARGAEYDEVVALEREKWSNWLDIMEPVWRMQLAGRR